MVIPASDATCWKPAATSPAVGSGAAGLLLLCRLPVVLPALLLPLPLSLPLLLLLAAPAR